MVVLRTPHQLRRLDIIDLHLFFVLFSAGGQTNLNQTPPFQNSGSASEGKV